MVNESEGNVLREYDNTKTYKENLRAFKRRHGYISQNDYFNILRLHGINRKVTDRDARKQRLRESVLSCYDPSIGIQENMLRLTKLTGFRILNTERYCKFLMWGRDRQHK